MDTVKGLGMLIPDFAVKKKAIKDASISEASKHRKKELDTNTLSILTGKRVNGYNEYRELLKKFILRNAKVEISEDKIRQFILSNNLEADWGITPSDVCEDAQLFMENLIIDNEPSSICSD